MLGWVAISLVMPVFGHPAESLVEVNIAHGGLLEPLGTELRSTAFLGFYFLIHVTPVVDTYLALLQQLSIHLDFLPGRN